MQDDSSRAAAFARSGRRFEFTMFFVFFFICIWLKFVCEAPQQPTNQLWSVYLSPLVPANRVTTQLLWQIRFCSVSIAVAQLDIFFSFFFFLPSALPASATCISSEIARRRKELLSFWILLRREGRATTLADVGRGSKRERRLIGHTCSIVTSPHTSPPPPPKKRQKKLYSQSAWHKEFLSNEDTEDNQPGSPSLLDITHLGSIYFLP